MSWLFPTRLENAKHYLEKAKETIIHEGKRRYNLDKAEHFLFEKRRELAQTNFKEWSDNARSFENELIEQVNEAYKDVEQGKRIRDLDEKKKLIISAWEFVEDAIGTEKKVRRALKKSRCNVALDHLK